ncbi:MAG: PAS domain-containing sensor histidine kinase [Comamonadaceae bacterium]|nr:MAG: PAS domain-containing sensor histidine kinase [Comamonadaceae bacterium]
MSGSQQLLDDAACGLARTASDGTFLHANRTFCEWVGYRGAELFGQRKLQELLTMGGRIFHQTHWHPLLQMQGSVSEVKLEVVHRDGHTLPMVMNAIRRESGGAMVHDIAVYIARDRDTYERELLASRRKLEVLVAEATRMQLELKDRALFAEQMVGIVSHDLRNPLSTVQMGAALLSRGEATPNQLRVLGRVARAAERANRLITDLLDFTQARMGKGLTVARQPMDLRATVSEVVEELALAYPGRKLLHRHEGACHCTADADRLSQLVGNLVSNAMAYGQPDAAVTVTSSVDEASSCLVAVHNLGSPIPAQVQAALFQPMVRGPAEVQSGSSVGLGLFIAAEIAKAHGGTVAVESTQETGTLFRANFPGA